VEDKESTLLALEDHPKVGLYTVLEGASSSSDRRSISRASRLDEVDIINVGHSLDMFAAGSLACVDLWFDGHTEDQECDGVTLARALR
jgi:hypothetical protein